MGDLSIPLSKEQKKERKIEKKLLVNRGREIIKKENKRKGHFFFLAEMLIFNQTLAWRPEPEK